MSDLMKYERYLKDDGPAALVIREYLVPDTGRDGVLFHPPLPRATTSQAATTLTANPMARMSVSSTLWVRRRIG